MIFPEIRKGTQLYDRNLGAYTSGEVKTMKEEEKKPLFWEIADPKLPVIQSGHMENRKK